MLLKNDNIKKASFSNGRCLLLTSGNKILEYSSSPDAKIKLKDSYTTKSNVFDIYCSSTGDAYYSVVEKHFVDSHNNIITKPLPGVSIFAKKQTVVSLYDLYTNKILFENVFDNEIQNVAISDDASLLAVSDAKGKVSLYDLRTGIHLESYKDLHKRGITTISFSKDNDYLLTSNQSNNTSLYDRKAKTNYYFNEHTNTCYSVFGNNGLFATYSGDGSIIIWNTHTRQKLTSDISGLGWHSIKKVNFFDDDKRIIAAYNNRVSIWDVSSGLIIGSFEKNETK